MDNQPTARLPTTTDDAVKLFFPGQKISLRPLDDRPVVTFTICKLFTPVTKSVVVLATSDSGADHPEQVVIKIYDPRYLDERIRKPSRPSYPWNLANERAAAIARPQNAKLSDEELQHNIYKIRIKDLAGEDLAAHYSFREERFYRDMIQCYDSELTAYERLKHLQGSVIPRFIMAGEFLPPDERAIRPQALVLEYIHSISLLNIPTTAITPALCSQVISLIESFPLHGVIHNDVSVTNVHFIPPERPARAIVIDFGCACIRQKETDEECWVSLGVSDARWVRRLLEDMASGERKWIPPALRE